MGSHPSFRVEGSRRDDKALSRICQNFCPCHIHHDKEQCTCHSVPDTEPERSCGVGCAGPSQGTAGPQALAGYWCSVYDNLHQLRIHPTVLFLQVHIYPSQLFYPCLTPLSVGVLFPRGKFDPSTKEMLWITLLSSLLGKHPGHAEVTPRVTFSSMGDIGERAGPSLSTSLSQSNFTAPSALGEENTPFELKTQHAHCCYSMVR